MSGLLFFLILKWCLSHYILCKCRLVNSSNLLGNRIFRKPKVSADFRQNRPKVRGNCVCVCVCVCACVRVYLCVLSKMIYLLVTRLTLFKKKIAWQPIFIFWSDNVWKEKRQLTVESVQKKLFKELYPLKAYWYYS